MIEEEQKELAEYIKGVHLSLRCKSRQIGAELAWKEHVENEEVLRNYAVCMKNLAEKYWSANNKKDETVCLCRIDWMVRIIKKYFMGEGIDQEFYKEKTKIKNFIEKSLVSEDELKKYENSFREEIKQPYRVLDVGSCYNPFYKFDFLDTYAIDLYPAISSVKKCDFTQLQTESFNSDDWFHDNIRTLPKNYFDIVIFSLFLEYLPSPEQRYQSCLKAFETLKINGLLLIATPDSKHESANSRIMKSWKIKLAQIGFVRIKLEKLRYMYCMAFRKSVFRKYPTILYNIRDSEHEEVIKIPQDFVEYEKSQKEIENFNKNEENIKKTFMELPFS